MTNTLEIVEECDWCDGEKVVCLGTGSQTDFFSCPICVGLCRDFLTSSQVEDAEVQAKTMEVSIQWKRAGE